MSKYNVPGLGTGGAVLMLSAAFVYALALGGHMQALGAAGWRVANGAADLVGLSIREVTVSGLERARPEDVLEIVGVTRGVSMIGFDAVNARQRLEHRDWIATASIRRQFPDRLHVVVRERQPYALWQADGVFHVIDREGVALSTFAVRDYIDLPIVVGASANEAAEGLLNHLEVWPDIRSRLKAAVLVAERRWTLHLNNGLRVLLPETDIVDALKRLDGMHREAWILDRDVIAVDLRLADRTVLRLSDEVKAAHVEARRGLELRNRGAGI